MARISVFLTDEVVLSATEGLKKLGKAGLVARKLQAIIAAKKYGISKTSVHIWTNPVVQEKNNTD